MIIVKPAKDRRHRSTIPLWTSLIFRKHLIDSGLKTIELCSPLRTNIMGWLFDLQHFADGITA
jgi:hypothetical protein